MLRRSTLILLGVCIILVIGAVLMDRSKVSFAPQTPTPTTEPLLFTNWPVGSATTRIELQSIENGAIILQRDAKNQWVPATLNGGQLDQGKIEEVLASLGSAKVIASPNVSGGASSVGLSQPSNILILTGQDGTKHTLKIGSTTPTGNGYYATLDNDSKIMVLEKSTIDDLLNNMNLEQLVVTPTPLPSPTVSVTNLVTITPTK
jgi:hypothetical protein